MANSYKRIDAHLSSLGYCTRSEAKSFFLNFWSFVKDKKESFDVSLKANHEDIL